jgi:hypothetical protein
MNGIIHTARFVGYFIACLWQDARSYLSGVWHYARFAAHDWKGDKKTIISARNRRRAAATLWVVIFSVLWIALVIYWAIVGGTP